MRIKVSNIKVSVKDSLDNLKEIIAKNLKCSLNLIDDYKMISKSVDARKKDDIFYVISFIVLGNFNESIFKNKHVSKYKDLDIKMKYSNFTSPYNPVIVGFGPAGIFASLYLTRCGANPIIIERGGKMEDRINDVEKFLKNKKLNIDSNIQFGEGGAGTFSDGKLQTNSNDPLIGYILNEFVRYGAPEEIKYESLPHIGTDNLRKVIKNMRKDMILRGAKFYFNTKLEDIELCDDYVIAKTNNNLEFKTRHLILGLGHSARDTFKMLYSKNVLMEPKSFSMGVRVEHKKEFINNMQYSTFSKYLDPASYKCAIHLDNGRSLYTFCMCPGGEVMASTSDMKSIVTNGMSYFKRDKENSNAALLVNVDVKDYYKNSPLDGMYFQEYYEREAFNISSDFRAPCNLMKEFIEGSVANLHRSVVPSYPHGVVFSSFDKCLPSFVVDTLKEGLILMDKKMKGFYYDDAILTGIESRSSSPVRILRDENGITNNFIYPIGEGAGYAGGITTAALDGLKCAMKIVNDYVKK